MKSKIVNLPKGVIALSLSTLFVAISTSMTFSISPFYITSVMGFSMLSLGSLEGFTEGLAQICKLLSGITGDYAKKRKPTLLVGFLLAALSKPLFILAQGSLMIVVSKTLERISNGIMATPRDAYVACSSPPHKIGAALGFIMSMKTIGCAVGSLLIACLLCFSENFQLLLWIGFIPCILAVIICWRYMDEAPDALPQPTVSSQQTLHFADLKKLPPFYWSLLLVASLFMAARFSDGFLVLRLKELGAPLYLSASTVAIFNGVSAFCCFPAGKLSDRYGRTNILYFSFLTLVLANVCLIFAQDVVVGLVGIVLWGAQRGTSQMLFSAMISDAAPKKILGTALGLFYLATGVLALIAGIMAGYLADMDIRYAFVYGAILTTIALIALIAHDLYYRYQSFWSSDIIDETSLLNQ